MNKRTRISITFAAVIGGGLLAGMLSATGCGAGGGAFGFLGSPFQTLNPDVDLDGLGSTPGGATGGNNGGGGLATGSRTFVDPCTLAMNRKLIRISMRNDSPDFIHYFVVMVATINAGANEGSGDVCPDDVDLYTSFGYSTVADGAFQELGNLCIQGPALIYFHRAGQFRAAGGNTLASGIMPAQGSAGTFDSFFTSSGAQLPVPSLIMFMNPGTGEGAALDISENLLSPCSSITVTGAPLCQQDAFYYVDDLDQIAGSTALGIGSGRRVPAEIQGTGCSCLGTNDGFQELAPNGVTAATANCNEYTRGGFIQYVFIRDDQNPPIPQLVWQVRDASGALVQEFDPRTNVQ